MVNDYLLEENTITLFLWSKLDLLYSRISNIITLLDMWLAYFCWSIGIVAKTI